MKAEKTRTLLNALECQACGRHAEIPTKGICAPSCAAEYRLDDEIEKELSELEAKATKWDMIQWAVDKEAEFIDLGMCGTHLKREDLEKLEKLFEESERSE